MKKDVDGTINNIKGVGDYLDKFATDDKVRDQAMKSMGQAWDNMVEGFKKDPAYSLGGATFEVASWFVGAGEVKAGVSAAKTTQGIVRGINAFGKTVGKAAVKNAGAMAKNIAHLATRGPGLAKDIGKGAWAKMKQIDQGVSRALDSIPKSFDEAYALADGALYNNFTKHNATVYMPSGSGNKVAREAFSHSDDIAKASIMGEAREEIAKYGDDLTHALKESGEQVEKRVSHEFGDHVSNDLAKHSNDLAKHGDDVSHALEETSAQVERHAAQEVSEHVSDDLAKHSDDVTHTLEETSEQVEKRVSQEFNEKASDDLYKHGDDVTRALDETSEQAEKRVSQEFNEKASDDLAKHGDDVSHALEESAELGALNKGLKTDFSQELGEDFAKHGDDVSRGLEEATEHLDDVVQEVAYGEQFTKGVNGRKELLPNVQYVTDDGYRYTTDAYGRISRVEVDELVLKKGTRNAHSQRVAGREDRIVEADTVKGLDDGGHLIGTQFNGSGDLDNLVAMNRDINRSGGEWYNMEQEWSKALKEVPPKKVTVDIKPYYKGESLRPDGFIVKYQIEGEGVIPKLIKNKIGG